MSAPRPRAWPLVPLYWAGLRAKDAFRAAGVPATRELSRPVISIGSLSAGGAGKTPTVIALANLLSDAGWYPDILSRGYGRLGKLTEQVDPSTPNAPARFGDEPVLIAQRTGVPVWVGASRFRSGALAESARSTASRAVHLLDDGFQHRQLARNFDIVLLTLEDLDQPLLPAGNRREPLSALLRADALIIREEERAAIEPRVSRLLRRDIPICVVRRTLTLPDSPGDLPTVAFCGIARPEGFFTMLRAHRVDLAASVAFPDHHRYTARDVSRIAESCHLEKCRFLTTEKDAVKLGPELRKNLETRGTLHVARLHTEFLDPGTLLRAIEARIA